MDDIRPPKRPVRVNPPPNQNIYTRFNEPKVAAPPQESAGAPDMPLGVPVSNPAEIPKPKKKRRVLRYIILSLALLIALTIVAAVFWYNWAISPKNNDSTKHTFVVESGEGLSVVAERLESQGLIRDSLSMQIYARINNKAGLLKAGSYRLSADQSVADITETMIKGLDAEATKRVMIAPGLTLKQLADPEVKGSFAAQGYSKEEIEEAFSADYSAAEFPLMKHRPEGASLEGYIFPETFEVFEKDDLKVLLKKSFTEFYKRIEKDGLEAKLQAQGLDLHQALTLGSIVEEETSTAKDQPQIAQVFLSRLKENMQLGSDVTFIYAAREMGVQPVPSLDSPYNTRIHSGLPPGPISTMSYTALKSVAEPAPGDYLFFVAGDDGNIYYSRTNAEHEALVSQHCQKLCNEPLE